MPKAPPSLVQQVDRTFTRRNPRRRNGLQDDTPNRENDVLRRCCHHYQQEASKAFARRIPSHLHVHSRQSKKSPRAGGEAVPPCVVANLHLLVP